MTVPGIGPLIATAIEALAPPPETFRSGRDFAAWVGLTPGAEVDGRQGAARPDLPHGRADAPATVDHRGQRRCALGQAQVPGDN